MQAYTKIWVPRFRRREPLYLQRTFLPMPFVSPRCRRRAAHFWVRPGRRQKEAESSRGCSRRLIRDMSACCARGNLRSDAAQRRMGYSWLAKGISLVLLRRLFDRAERGQLRHTVQRQRYEGKGHYTHANMYLTGRRREPLQNSLEKTRSSIPDLPFLPASQPALQPEIRLLSGPVALGPDMADCLPDMARNRD